MRLSWTRASEPRPKEMGAQTLRQKEMAYAEALKEIHAALKSGFEIFWIRNDRLILLKAKEEDDDLFILVAEGAESEINLLQEDEIIKKSFFRAP